MFNQSRRHTHIKGQKETVLLRHFFWVWRPLSIHPVAHFTTGAWTEDKRLTSIFLYTSNPTTTHPLKSLCNEPPKQ